MAEVFEAILLGDQGFERRVALKRVLPGRERDPELVEMFADEARIAARLSHANILAVTDFGMWDESPFQLLELVDGVDLSSLYQRVVDQKRRFPVALALFVCAEVARGLHHAHTACDAEGASLGVVHRDVKPANILVAWEGSVKLSDFGIALAHKRLAQRTQTGIVKGTPAFMAPEHTMGCRVDPRADVFALASVLHYLITGQTPIGLASSPMAVLRKQEVPISPDIPAPVRPLLEEALAFDVENRLPSALLFVERAEAAIRELGVHDARGALSRFLSEIRASDRTPQGAVTPQDIVLLAGGDARSLVARSIKTPVATHAPASMPAQSSDTRQSTERTPSALTGATLPMLPMRKSRAGLVAGVMVSAVAVGAAAVFASGAPDAKPLRTSMTAVVDQRAADTQDNALLPVAIATAPAAPLLAASASASVSPGATGVAASGATAATLGKGTLSVAGAAIRKHVLVDGVNRGVGPIEIDLPVGTHTVSFLDDEGRTVKSTQVAVMTNHTHSAPLRWAP